LFCSIIFQQNTEIHFCCWVKQTEKNYLKSVFVSYFFYMSKMICCIPFNFAVFESYRSQYTRCSIESHLWSSFMKWGIYIFTHFLLKPFVSILCLDESDIYSSLYRADYMCWIHQNSLYFGFLLIAGLTLLHNIAVLIQLGRILILKKTEVRVIKRRCELTTTYTVLDIKWKLIFFNQSTAYNKRLGRD